MEASSATLARSAESGNRCAHVFDNCSRLVPIVAAIFERGRPAAIAHDANVWRIAYGPRWGRPAARSAGVQCRERQRWRSIGVPLCVVKSRSVRSLAGCARNGPSARGSHPSQLCRLRVGLASFIAMVACGVFGILPRVASTSLLSGIRIDRTCSRIGHQAAPLPHRQPPKGEEREDRSNTGDDSRLENRDISRAARAPASCAISDDNASGIGNSIMTSLNRSSSATSRSRSSRGPYAGTVEVSEWACQRLRVGRSSRTRLSSSTDAIRAARERTPNLANIRRRCVATVQELIPRLAAIVLLG